MAHPFNKMNLFVICHNRQRGMDFVRSVEHSLGKSLKEDYRITFTTQAHSLYGSSSHNTFILYTPGYKDIENIKEIEHTIKYAELKPLAI